MALGKWIGGFLGFAQGGPLGAIVGFVIGWLFDKQVESFASEEYNNREYDNGPSTYSARNTRQAYEGQRNSFLFSMLTLAAYIIRADGRVMHSEMETLRRFLRTNFGEQAVSQGENIVLAIFDHQKKMGAAAFRETIRSACEQISWHLNYSERLQLLNFLVILAQADGIGAPSEIAVLKEVAAYLGLTPQDVDSMLNLNGGAGNLEAAYKVLGVPPTATDDEVKAAYRKMALKHHPDRVATLGDDVRRAAEQKFKEINEAKETIFKARNL